MYVQAGSKMWNIKGNVPTETVGTKGKTPPLGGTVLGRVRRSLLNQQQV